MKLNLPDCDCGENFWFPGKYHDFYCGDCGATIDIVEEE